MTISLRAAGFLLFAAMAVTGTYVALSKALVAAFPVFVLAGLRFAIAALALLPWMRATPADATLTPSLWRTLFLESFFGNFLFSICMLYGVSMTSATSAGVILATIPAMTAVFSWALLREPLSTRTCIAIAFSVTGILVLQWAKLDGGAASSGTSPAYPQAWLGNLLVFGAVCCEALYVVIGKRLTAHLSPKRISALINLIGLGLTVPFFLWQVQGFSFSGITPASSALLVFYAIAASMLTTWLWLTGLTAMPANQAGVFTIVLPLAACVVGVLFLGESITLPHLLAFACAAAGVLLITAKPSTG